MIFLTPYTTFDYSSFSVSVSHLSSSDDSVTLVVKDFAKKPTSFFAQYAAALGDAEAP